MNMYHKLCENSGDGCAAIETMLAITDIEIASVVVEQTMLNAMRL